MRLEQLNFILEIYHHNSMKAAAENLFITPQALSAMVKSIEEELNIQIFNRSNKGIALTSEGKDFIEFAESTIDNFQHLMKSLNASADKEKKLSGELTLYVAPIFYELIIPMHIGEFKQKYPNISTGIVQRSVKSVISTLSESMDATTIGGLVIPMHPTGGVSGYIPHNQNDFLYKILNRNHYLACVPPDSPLANQRSVSLKKLLKYPLVDYCAGDIGTSAIVALLKQYNPNLKISMSVSSFSVWAQAIREHMGVGVMNTLFNDLDFQRHHPLNDLVLLKINEGIDTFNCFVYSKNPAPSVTEFLKLFPEYLPRKNDPAFKIGS